MRAAPASLVVIETVGGRWRWRVPRTGVTSRRYRLRWTATRKARKRWPEATIKVRSTF